MSISKPTKAEITLSATIVEAYTPDELVSELKKFERIIQDGTVDLINGAKLVAVMRAARRCI